MWHWIDEEQQKKDLENQMRILNKVREEAELKQKARDAHEANRCPHCGRNDPMPPWLD